MKTLNMSPELVPGDTVTPLALFRRLERLDLVLDQLARLALVLVPAASPMMALLRDLLAPSPSTTWESSIPDVRRSMETPPPGVPPRLMKTLNMSPELVHGDTVMPLALFRRLERLDLVPDQLARLDPDLVPAALPMMALLRDLLAPSLLTSWESSTSDVRRLMETQHPGVPPRLMKTLNMSPELVPGDTVMPLALFKKPLPPQQPLLQPHLTLDLLSLLPLELASAA